MNYEIERALSNKAEKWELQNVANENQQLKSTIKELEQKLNQNESQISVANQKITQLCDLLIESQKFKDEEQLYNIKNLY